MNAISQFPLGPVPTTKATSSRPLWLTGLIAGVAAAALNLGIALVATAADVSLEVPNEKPIPVLAFPQLTLVFSAIGFGLAAVLSRRARQPRRTFVVTTIALTLLSFVAPLLLDPDRATVIALELAHAAAAALVIPMLAVRTPISNGATRQRAR